MKKNQYYLRLEDLIVNIRMDSDPARQVIVA